MAITQESYVNDSSSVKAARKRLTEAKAALADAQKAKEGLPSSSTTQLTAQVNKRVAAAKAAVEEATNAVTAAETKAKNYFTKNEEAINAKAASKAEADIAAGKEDQAAILERMRQAGLDTSALEQQIKSKTKPTAAEAGTSSGTETGKTPQQQPEDFKTLLKTSTDFIKNMSGPERKLLAQSLNDSLGLNLPVSELIDPSILRTAYNSAITGAQARYKDWGDVFTVSDYLAQKKLETDAIKQAGGSGASSPWGQIYDPSQAKSAISGVITSLLGREATAKEISSITKQLTAAQASHPYRKNAQGMTVGGLNAEQFITDIVKAMPEYETKKQAKQDLTAADIAETARLNGINLSKAQLATYADRVKNGEDIKTINNEIRSVGSLGMPDEVKKLMAAGTDLATIYAPYKRAMASSLGINPDTISLDDPTLRSAIGPDREMSLYDFKKAIRQDNRWKYSQEANDEVTNMINQVKRDFGFMG